jgi:hypothetical protein
MVEAKVCRCCLPLPRSLVEPALPRRPIRPLDTCESLGFDPTVATKQITLR